MLLHKKTVLAKKRLFFYKLNGSKITAFLHKYIFVKKLLFM